MITFLRDPSAYYSLLLAVFERSESSVLLSALYMGDGPLERALVDAIDRALERKPALEVKLLLDYNRAHRRKDSSLPALRALVDKHGPRLHVLLYKTPLSSTESALLSLPLVPEEAKEVCGVFHCKFCVFDGSVLLTGANLSEEYFRDRQDRYALVDGDAAGLAAFLRAFAGALESHCHRVLPTGLTAAPKSSLEQPEGARRLRSRLQELQGHTYGGEGGFLAALHAAARSDSSVSFLPLVQNRPVGLEGESAQLPALLCEGLRVLGGAEGYDVTIATPYPNFAPSLLRQLEASLAAGTARSLSIVVPSHASHGFARASGPRALVPLLHSHITHSTLGKLAEEGRRAQLRPLCYHRHGWTFHGKGVWMLPRDPAAPSVSYVGSSNFGLRSWSRDFELGFAVVARGERAKLAMSEEVANLHKYTSELSARSLGRGPVALLAWAFRSFL